MTDSPRIVESLDAIPAGAWDRLHGGNPTLAHAFLDSLHRSGCASPATGWAPRYLTRWEGRELTGAVPLYAKSHSYGEYVFDWAWADAYERHGLAYYPKLLAAVPFTPATGGRLLAASDAVRDGLARDLLEHAQREGFSSLHVLFPAEADAGALRRAGLLERTGTQFHWRNAGYACHTPTREGVFLKDRAVWLSASSIGDIDEALFESQYQPLFAADVASQRLTPPPYLFSPILRSRTITMLSGEPYAGKTLLSMYLLLHLDLGLPLFGRFSPIHNHRCLFLGQDAPTWDYHGQLPEATAWSFSHQRKYSTTTILLHT